MVESFFSTGTKEFDTVQIIGFDEPQSVFTVSSPLTHYVSAGNGAVMSLPPVGNIPIHSLRTNLYGDIIDKAFDYYIEGGELPRGI